MFLRTLWELLNLSDLKSRFLPKLLKNLCGCSQRTLVKVLPSATNDGSGIHSQQLLENSKDTQTVPGHLRESFSRLRRARTKHLPTLHTKGANPCLQGSTPGAQTGKSGATGAHPSSPPVIAPHLHLIRDCISPEIVSRDRDRISVPSPPRALRGLCRRKGKHTHMHPLSVELGKPIFSCRHHGQLVHPMFSKILRNFSNFTLPRALVKMSLALSSVAILITSTMPRSTSSRTLSWRRS